MRLWMWGRAGALSAWAGSMRKLPSANAPGSIRHTRPARSYQGASSFQPIGQPLSGTQSRRAISAELIGMQRSEEHTSELQSRENLVCRLLLEKKKKTIT